MPTSEDTPNIQPFLLDTTLPPESAPMTIYLASLAPSSRPTMKTSLNMCAKDLTNDQADALHLNWGAIRSQHTVALQAKLVAKYRPAMVNKIISALRGVLKIALSLGQISSADYMQAIAPLKRVKSDSVVAGRLLTKEEITAVMNACVADQTPAGIRDAALIAMLYVSGLHRAEICALHLADYDSPTGTLTIKAQSEKVRTVQIKGNAAELLTAWLQVRGNEAGSLFVPILKNGRLSQRTMTSQAIYLVLFRRADKAGIQGLTAQDFRRTFFENLLEAGADIFTVQRLAGHASVATTAQYDRRAPSPTEIQLDVEYEKPAPTGPRPPEGDNAM